MLFHGGHVLVVIAQVEQSGMHLRGQRFHAAVEHFRKAGKLGNIFNRNARIAQGFGGSAGREQVDPAVSQRFGELNNSGLVRNT